MKDWSGLWVVLLSEKIIGMIVSDFILNLISQVKYQYLIFVVLVSGPALDCSNAELPWICFSNKQYFTAE